MQVKHERWSSESRTRRTYLWTTVSLGLCRDWVGFVGWVRVQWPSLVRRPSVRTWSWPGSRSSTQLCVRPVSIHAIAFHGSSVHRAILAQRSASKRSWIAVRQPLSPYRASRVRTAHGGLLQALAGGRGVAPIPGFRGPAAFLLATRALFALLERPALAAEAVRIEPSRNCVCFNALPCLYASRSRSDWEVDA